MIDVVVSFRVKDSEVDPFRETMRSVKTSLPQVSGCHGVRIFQGVDDPSLFTLIESWESKQTHRAHIALLLASGQWSQILGYLAAEPVTNYVQEL